MLNLDGVVKSPIYCALVPGQTFDVPYVLLQAWPEAKSCIWALFLSHLITFYECINLATYMIYCMNMNFIKIYIIRQLKNEYHQNFEKANMVKKLTSYLKTGFLLIMINSCLLLGAGSWLFVQFVPFSLSHQYVKHQKTYRSQLTPKILLPYLCPAYSLQAFYNNSL